MTSNFIKSSSNFTPDPNDDVVDSIFKQYERVIIESIITSFGLDFIVKDTHGGDVDTIHNVRQIDTDDKMVYKNKVNQAAYKTKGDYNSDAYHKDSRYIETNREASKQKKAGELKDAYSGKTFERNDKTNLDHVVSAKEIDSDRGRSLAGLSGVELANSPENLRITSENTNKSKKADTMDAYLERTGDKHSEEEKARMREIDSNARESYEKKLATAYYTSPEFVKDTAMAAGKAGVQMGVRQVLGFVFMEIWFSVKQEFEEIDGVSDFEEFFSAIANGVKRGAENAMEKHKELIAKFGEGIVSGALASITTTLCNIFFTTSKSTVRVIRCSYVSVVQAGEVLLINPDGYMFGERIRAAVKFLAVGASVAAGVIISEALAVTALGTIPIVGSIVQTFCGSFVTGIMSCSLLYWLDRSSIMNKLVATLDRVNTIEGDIAYYKAQALFFEGYAAQLMEIDVDKFGEETEKYNQLLPALESAQDDEQLNEILLDLSEKLGLSLPWSGDFDSHMSDKNNSLVFK